MKKVIFAEDFKNIFEKYKGGLSPNEISKITGFSRRTIQRHLHKNNVKVRNIKEAVALVKKKPLKISEQDVTDIIKQYKNGTKISILADKYKLTTKGILYHLNKNKVKIRKVGENRKYLFREDYFDNINKEGPSYFLGLLFSDGYNSTDKGQISISQDCKDVDILEKFKSQILISGDMEIKKYSKKASGFRKKGTIANTLLICNKKLSDKLNKLGCVQRKTNVLTFPTTLNKKYVRHFLRGYIDGDGNIFCGKSISVSLTGTKDFTSYLYSYLKEIFNIEIKINTEHRCKDNIKKLSLNRKQDCLLFLNWIYEGSKIYGDRKYSTYMEIKKRVK